MSFLMRLSRHLARVVDERADLEDPETWIRELADGVRRIEYALLFTYPGGLLAAWWEGYPEDAIVFSAAVMLVWIVLYAVTRHTHSLTGA